MCGLAGVAAAWVLVFSGGGFRAGWCQPSTFSYLTLGLSDYESRNGNFDWCDLKVGSMHYCLHKAVTDNIGSWDQSTWFQNCGYRDDVMPVHFHDNNCMMNYFDFVSIHAHSGPAHCDTDLGPFYIGDPWRDGGIYRIRPSMLKFGSHNLKWLFAYACDWFNVGESFNTNVWPLGMCSTTGDGHLEFECYRGICGEGTARYFDRVSPGETGTTYLAEGVNVQHTSLTVTGTSGRYKRCNFVPDNTPHGVFQRTDNCNTIVLYASAPGSGYKGQVQVRVGRLPRAANEQWDAGETIASVSVNGSRGAQYQYEVDLSGGIGQYDGWDARDLYLCFSGCTAPITIHNVLLYYYPLHDDRVRQTMKERVSCYGSMMQGVHAVMGFTAPLDYYGSDVHSANFMKNWLSDGMSTATAFLSIPADRPHYYKPPDSPPFMKVMSQAIAVPPGPPGENRYYYLYERWEDAGDELAPTTGSCMIAWCVPYFDQGYYWVEPAEPIE